MSAEYRVEPWTTISTSDGEFQQYAVVKENNGKPFAFAFGSQLWCEEECARWNARPEGLPTISRGITQ